MPKRGVLIKTGIREQEPPRFILMERQEIPATPAYLEKKIAVISDNDVLQRVWVFGVVKVDFGRAPEIGLLEPLEKGWFPAREHFPPFCPAEIP